MRIEIPGEPFSDEQLQNLADARLVLEIPFGEVDSVAEVAQAYCAAKRLNLLDTTFSDPYTFDVSEAQMSQLLKLANADEIQRRKVQRGLAALNKMQAKRNKI